MSVGAGTPRVVRLITRLNIGGPARQALLLTHRLAPSYETTLAAGAPEQSEGELTDDRVSVVRLPFVRPVQPPTDLRAARAVRDLLRRVRPAIVHTHMAKAGAIGRLVAHRLESRPRLVHTFHGHVLDGYFSRPVTKAFLAAERALARRTDVLVAVSGEIRDQLLELGIGRSEQYRVIPLGLDLTLHYASDEPPGAFRSSLGIAVETPLVGVVGRLVPIKDVATLFGAMRRLPDAHLAVVGDGELRFELERLAQDPDLGGRVHFTGWRPDVATVMRDLDVVALSSRNEGTPVALIEAAAAGKPAVATDVGGVRSVVEDGVTGFLAPAGDADLLGERIGQLLADPALRQRMGEAGRQRARRFDESRLVGDITSLYNELLIERG